MDTKNKLISLDGVIVSSTNYKEYDKLLTILTDEKGKIEVYAFGVRRANSKKIGKVRPFAFSTFEIKEIKDRYELENVIVKESFDDLSKNYDDSIYANYFLELSSYFNYENEESTTILNLIYYSFKALLNNKIDKKLIRRIFELKMLQYEGIYKGSKDLHKVDETLIYTWDYILKNNPRNLYNFKLDDLRFKMFDDEMTYEMKEKVNKKFKSLTLL